MGWQREDMKLVQQMASNGAEPIGSLGYDGPLAALSEERQNLADYFKETVAVVTNPAIDREREIEHFSCRAVFGARPRHRPPAGRPAHDRDRVPDHPRRPPRHGAAVGRGLPRGGARSTRRTCSRTCGRRSAAAAAVIDISCLEAETVEGALERLKFEAAQEGARRLPSCWCCRTAPRFEGERPWLDPHLALAAIDRALREYRVEPGEENLRRRTSIVLRSGAIRNVHDVCMALGLGADGVCPYVMIEVICVDDYEQDISNICSALRKGMEKVISTLGIHELRGYSRLFSAIGLRARAGRDLRHAGLLRLRRRRAPASPS